MAGSREFAALRPFSGLGGYHNEALGTVGVAVAIPANATGFDVQTDVGCFVGVYDNNTLIAFNDTNYGSVLYGGRYVRQRLGNTGAEDFIHIAAWTGTAQVAIAFF